MEVIESTEASDYCGRLRREVEEALDRCLPKEDEYPFKIHQAMRYIVLPGTTGARRWRPILCLIVTESVFGRATAETMPVACALELMHSGSLALDDLPCMDDASIRRGKPACHKEFGEAATILASVALSQLADSLVAEACAKLCLPASRFARVVQELKAAVGTRGGAIGGQSLDVDSSGVSLTEKEVEYIYSSKAGSLYACAATLPALLLDAGDRELECLKRYGRLLGFTYQIYDDILDAVADAATLGKDVRMDGRKNTFVSLYGLGGARARALESERECLRAVDPLGSKAEPLRELLRSIFWIRLGTDDTTARGPSAREF